MFTGVEVFGGHGTAYTGAQQEGIDHEEEEAAQNGQRSDQVNAAREEAKNGYKFTTYGRNGSY
jgi:hypothetical protein